MNAPTSTARSIDAITQQAAAWFARLRADDVTGADRTAFQRWLQQDLEHRAAYERFEHFWSKSGEYAGEPAVAKAMEGAKKSWRPWLWTTAASIALAVVAATFLLSRQNDGMHATRVGERETIELQDGSQVTLNTNTKLQVEFSAAQRLVRLDRGQAYFKVAKDETRPFEVVARDGVVRALGTEFDVYQQDTQVLVTLVEGKVAVSRSRSDDATAGPAEVMHPGQSVALQAGAPSVKLTASVKRSTAWLAGKLVFDDEPLDHAVAEANRYSKQHIALGNEQLKQLRISGVYRAGEPDEFVYAISAYFPVRAVEDDQGNFVLMAQ